MKAFWLLAAIVFASSPALADENSVRAKESFRQAQAAFTSRNYAAAAAAFEQAGSFVPHPAAFLNAEEAWELDGNFPRAADACERAMVLAAGVEPFAKTARARLDRLLPKVGTLELSSRRSVLAQIDGGESATVPLTRHLSAGTHRVVVTDPSDQKTETLTVDLQLGAVVHRDVFMSPVVVPLVTPPPPIVDPIEPPRVRSWAPPVPSWIAFGVAVASTGVAIVEGEVTLGTRRTFIENPTIESRDSFYRTRTVTNVAVGVAGLSLAVGIVVWIVNQSSRPTTASARAPLGIAF